MTATAVNPRAFAITLNTMRAAVAGWMREERATKEQALQMLDALYAGAIDGKVYCGTRERRAGTRCVHGYVMSAANLVPRYEYNVVDNTSCGCLVDTLEQLRGERPDAMMGPLTSVAFTLALKIPLGGTPTNDAWAKAAAQGIEDYIAAKGW